MSQVRIVTDSTADIPAELRERLGISVVPLKVLFGSESFRDGVDMGPEQFYTRLAASSGLPTTSQPSPVEFLEEYQRLAEQGSGPILSIHLSAALSGTYQSAMIAASMAEEKIDVTVFDSRSASYGIGLLVVAAAEAAREGKSKEEIVELITTLRKQTRLYFLVDTLEYLQKGGRIGRAAALVGSLLNIKPILSVNEEGEVYSVDKVRGHKKAMSRIVELLQQDFGSSPIRVMSAYTTGGDAVDELYGQIAKSFEIRGAQSTQIGPVIGTHVGPGTVAAFVIPG